MRFNFSSHVFIFILLLSPFTITGNFQNVFAANLTPVADLTGQWSGFAQFTIPEGYCEYSGKVNAYLKQDGNNLVGEFSWVATSSKSIDPEIYECDYSGFTYSDDLQGTISGSQLTLYSSTATFTGWYASSGIKLDIVFDDAMIGITQLSPTGFSPPAFTPEDEPTQPKEKEDTDYDGISDDKDQCLNLKEDYYGKNDEDGCPEKDSDGDNIYDYLDKCPNEKEDFGENFTDGCPEKKTTTPEVDKTTDSDRDGVPDYRDLCTNEAAPGTLYGCPKEDNTQVTQNVEKVLTDELQQLKDALKPKDWAEEGVPIESDTPELLRSETGGAPILQVPKPGELKIYSGDIKITTSDGKVVNSNTLKLGQTIQTGEKAGTNVQIGLEGGGTINLKENTQVGTVRITSTDGNTLSLVYDADPQLNDKIAAELAKKPNYQQISDGLVVGAIAGEALVFSLVVAGVLAPAALVGSGVAAVVIVSGSVFFSSSTSNDVGKNQNNIFATNNGVFVNKQTEFTITVEGETTKLDVIDGEVLFIPNDESRPQMVISAGNSILVSDEKIEETKLDTVSVDKWWEVSAQEPQQSKSGGCLIATATYGSELVPQVQFLREIRDNTVLSTASGTSFMTAFNSFYYSFSPTIADLERQNPAFKEFVKLTITPLLSSLSLLQYVDIDSEEEMLGYGISIILLNIGMYFIAPAILIIKLKKRLAVSY